MRLAAALLPPDGLQDKTRSRRLFDDKVECAVFVDLHDHGENASHERTRLIVELIDEFANVDARRAKRGTNGRRRRGLPSLDLQFDDFGNFFCHERLLYLQRLLISSSKPLFKATLWVFYCAHSNTRLFY